MKLEVGEKFPIEINENGTVMDFVENEFLFVIRDDVWSEFEIKALQKNTIRIEFVYKFDIAVFLITVDDAIDTSDFVFNIHDNEYDDALYLKANENVYNVCVCLIDKESVVRGKRSITLSKDASQVIAAKLIQQKDTPYYEEEFMCNLEGLQSAYEPYEMQPLALVSEKF